MSHQYHVRSSQTVATVFFCLGAAARACLEPFVPVFLRHHALNAFYAGAVVGTAAFTSTAVVPAALWLPRWRRQNWRSLLFAASAVAVVCYLALLVVPPVSNVSGWSSPCASGHRVDVIVSAVPASHPSLTTPTRVHGPSVSATPSSSRGTSPNDRPDRKSVV